MPIPPIMAIGAGICSAVAMYSIVVGSVLALPMFYLAPLPLYLAGLGVGAKGLLVAIAAALVTISLLGSLQTAIPYAVAYAVPTVIFCRHALLSHPTASGKATWTPPGHLVATMSAIGCTALVAVGLASMMDADAVSLQQTVSNFLGTAIDAMNDQLPADTRDAIVLALGPLFPGMAVSSWIIMHLASAALGQSVLVRMKRNLRPAVTYRNLTLPDWCSWVLVISGAVALALPGDLGYIGHNLVIVALLPFFILGLAVAHTFARQTPKGPMLLVIFYVLLVVLGWAAFAVAGAGIVEQWIGLRKRLQPASNQESE